MNALKQNNEKVYWILLGLLGLLMIIFHRSFAHALIFIAGIGLIVVGAVGLLGWWNMRADKSPNVLGQLVGALLMVVFGIVALSNPGTFSRIISIAAAVVLAWTCIQKLIANKGFAGDKAIGIVCIAGIVLAVLLVVGRLDVMSSGLALVGCGMLYTTCVGLLKQA